MDKTQAAANNRRDARFARRILLPAVLIIAGSIIGGAITHHHDVQTAQTADWTTPACSVYKYTKHPDLPPYTRTDQCYTPANDGTDGYTISTGDHQWTAAY